MSIWVAKTPNSHTLTSSLRAYKLGFKTKYKRFLILQLVLILRVLELQKTVWACVLPLVLKDINPV